MENYNILQEVAGIILKYSDVDDSRKPEWWPDEDWQGLSIEVKSLFCRCKELSDILPKRFHEATRREEWKLALFIYMHGRHVPWLPLKLLNLETYERCWDERKLTDFAAEAKEWIAEAEGLLQWEQF